MENKTTKRLYQRAASICLMILATFFVTPCSGQEKETQDNTASSGKPAIQQTYIDPYFYIPGQLCQHLREIYQDKTGNLWFGTNVYGLMRYNGDTLQYFTKKDGVGGGRITGIVEDKEGVVWFGTYGGLTKFDMREESGKLFTNFTNKDGLLNNEIWGLTIDRKGILWIATNEGVSRFDGKAFTTFPIPKAQVKDTNTVYAYDRITCVMEDSNGCLWFGTDGFGICKYDPAAEHTGKGRVFTHFTQENGLPDNVISDMMEDTKGNIWIGTFFGGISRYDGKSFTNFTQDGVIDGVEVGGLYEDKAGNIWFAAENYGVYRYNGEEFLNLYTKDGLNTNAILSIFQDREGRFWFGGWGGLFRYDGKFFISVTKDGPWEK